MQSCYTTEKLRREAYIAGQHVKRRMGVQIMVKTFGFRVVTE
jgi:hypothetical protein